MFPSLTQAPSADGPLEQTGFFTGIKGDAGTSP